jgi:signal transduction histidine kinase/ligand-binding sensor domain-containing protein/DNA-binding response OmpR family regulator
MSMAKNLFALFLCSCLFIKAQENTFKFEHLSTVDGLSQSSVIAMAQDSLGFMWIGTRDGLNRYDGHVFTTFKTEVGNGKSLSSSDILSLAMHPSGDLWVGTYNGLNRWDSESSTFERFLNEGNANSAAGNVINDLFIGHHGELFVATDRGIILIDPTGKVSTPPLFQSLKNFNIQSVFVAQNNNLYAGTDKGVYLFTQNNGSFEKPVLILKDVVVQDIIEDQAGTLLLGSSKQGILKIEKDSQKIEPYNLYSATVITDIRQLLFDAENRLWVGTYNGIFIVENGNATHLKSTFSDAGGLQKNSVKSLFLDKDDSVWAGTYNGGVHLWNSRSNGINNYVEGNGDSNLNYSVVSAIQADDDYLYIATELGGLNILDRKEDTFSYVNSGKSGSKEDNLKALLLDQELLWIGTFNNGISIYDTRSQKINTSSYIKAFNNSLNNIGVYDIKKRGNELYVATFGKGIFVYDTVANRIVSQYNTSNGLSSNLVRTIYIDTDESVWAGTQNGLNHITGDGVVTHYLMDEKLNTGFDILDIYRDSNKVLWIGTKSHGLYKFSENSFENVALNYNSTSFTTAHSISDAGGFLWISTNRGIVKMNLKTEKTDRVYDVKDGLAGNEYSDGAVLKINNKQLFYGGVSGVSSIPIENVSNSNFTTPVLFINFSTSENSENSESQISNLSANGKGSRINPIELAHNDRSFSVQFSMPLYYNTAGRTYRYRLNGLESAWKTTFENEVSYTLQESGSYVFEIQGVNSDGVLSDQISSLYIEALPAPWFSWWAYVFYTIIVAIVILFLIRNFRIRTQLKESVRFEQKEQEQIKAVNESKLQFFTNISHEFRTPLTLIIGPLQQLLSDYQGNRSMYKKLLVVESNANQLLQLINRLMDFRKLEQQQFSLQAAEGNIVKFLREISLSFTEHARLGDYEYSFVTSDEEILVYYDRNKLERVFYNLISNAFKFTPKGGTITVYINQTESEIIIKVQDTGMGVDEQDQQKIFDRFYEGSKITNDPVVNEKMVNDARSQGTGIGLNIAKNIVELHHGNISLESEKRKGSIFTVSLLKGRKHLHDEEIIEDFKFSDDLDQYTSQKTSLIDEERGFKELDLSPSDPENTVLIVEDSTALRTFMVQLLKPKFKVLEAADGLEGFEIAIKEHPDVIVSDVVMPNMDGTALCAKLKQDIRTSHIPVILLTSRTSLVYKLEGLESGADDYISKPFDLREFQLRIQNQLRTKEKLKEKLSSAPREFGPEEIEVTSVDEKLLKTAIEIVENNIPNEQFDIPMFSSELGVSRTMLFIKIKAWTNFTPNEFIQHFRMKRAAQLLQTGKLNISEVSYKVGFKNPKYFSKCFLKAHGETPTAFIKRFTED